MGINHYRPFQLALWWSPCYEERNSKTQSETATQWFRIYVLLKTYKPSFCFPSLLPSTPSSTLLHFIVLELQVSWGNTLVLDQAGDSYLSTSDFGCSPSGQFCVGSVSSHTTSTNLKWEMCIVLLSVSAPSGACWCLISAAWKLWVIRTPQATFNQQEIGSYRANILLMAPQAENSESYSVCPSEVPVGASAHYSPPLLW